MTALSDDQIMVRGGILTPKDLENAALMASLKMGRSGWSVYSAPAESPSALLDVVHDCFPHLNVSFARAGHFREKGFDIVKTGDDFHHSVFVPEDDEGDLTFWITQFRTTLSHVVRREHADSVLPLA